MISNTILVENFTLFLNNYFISINKFNYHHYSIRKCSLIFHVDIITIIKVYRSLKLILTLKIFLKKYNYLNEFLFKQAQYCQLLLVEFQFSVLIIVL